MRRTVISLCLVAAVAAAGCKKAELSVPAVQQQLFFEPSGGTVFASISASGVFEASSDAQWCYVEVYDHPGNNLRISVAENEFAVMREAVITLTMPGVPSRTLTVRQFASDPYITIVSKPVVLDASTLSFEVTVNSNVPYAYTLPSWIHDGGENTVGTGKMTYLFTVDAIGTAHQREGSIAFVCSDNPLVSAALSVTQTNEVLPLIDDSFDWCGGTANSVGSTSGEVRFDSLTETGGWSCETVEGNYNCWARAGYMRFSRTGYGGILVSPALRGISGTADVTVTFQAARWCNSNLVHDDNYTFTVLVRGGGTPSQSSFEITCDYDVEDWQAKADATYSFTISGATAETQIVWISAPSENAAIPSSDGNGDGTSSKVGRLLLDNVKVEYK